MEGREPKVREGGAAGPGPAADPRAPYVRLAVAALIPREGGRPTRADPGETLEPSDAVRWLLVHRREPVDAWDPPGGRAEAGEDLTAAAQREVAEETGLAVEVAGPCYAYLTFHKGERLLAVSMACRPLGDPDDLTLEAGLADRRWASVAEWEELARSGRSTWNEHDVRRALRMAQALWDVEAEWTESRRWSSSEGG
ncbi:MAG: NUDIX hydrolase [Thermoleophilia bacterium]|nr:NUDIX hydrolase [Thermoleophilia bacterium]